MSTKDDSNDISDELPPSYDEAVSQTDTGSNYSRPTAFVPESSNSPSSSSKYQVSNHTNINRPNSSSTPHDTSSLYGNNDRLPFKYSRGYFCQKCKNTGYKMKNGKMCRTCWQKFYLNDHSYNPNPKLPFKYPIRYLCEKCQNTGYKLKNGRSCQDCWSMFGPRNTYTPIASSTPSFLDSFFGTTQYIQPMPGSSGSSLPPLRVPPGDPRLGGILCGRCRGSGLITSFFDDELCNVCHGLGRIVNGLPQSQAPHPHFQSFHPPGPAGPQFGPSNPYSFGNRSGVGTSRPPPRPNPYGKY